LQTAKGDGEQLISHYREAGLRTLGEHATQSEGGVSVEAGCLALLERMQTGRFKVFDLLSDWLEEFRHYQRKNGRIVDEREDLMAATRYAHMMLRLARTNALLKPSFENDASATNKRDFSQKALLEQSALH
jgi:hypothetical protein